MSWGLVILGFFSLAIFMLRIRKTWLLSPGDALLLALGVSALILGLFGMCGASN